MKKYHRILLSISMLLASYLSPVSAQEKPEIKWGGAVRFNYNYSDWKEGNKKRGGDLGFDVFRLNVLGGYKNIMLDAEYRLYATSSGGGMLKHGWVGYRFDNQHTTILPRMVCQTEKCGSIPHPRRRKSLHLRPTPFQFATAYKNKTKLTSLSLQQIAALARLSMSQ